MRKPKPNRRRLKEREVLSKIPHHILFIAKALKMERESKGRSWCLRSASDEKDPAGKGTIRLSSEWNVSKNYKPHFTDGKFFKTSRKTFKTDKKIPKDSWAICIRGYSSWEKIEIFDSKQKAKPLEIIERVKSLLNPKSTVSV